MSRKKLAPMPTGSALARFVARIVSHIVRRWPFSWSATVRERERKIHNQRDEIWHLLQKAYALELDLDEMARRNCPPILARLDVRVYDDMLTHEAITCVEFQPLKLAISYQEARRGFSAAGSEIMRRTAHALAREHAAEVEQVILQRLIRINEKIGGRAERQGMPW